ncbi:MAG: ParA family protein [Gammaproteobacteria bacterium]|nr:ParA family protein [Gammaproteobacteria bacterium]
MRIIAVMNQKGGVGKTTTSINLAHALALAGNRVFGIDMDPQGQFGLGFGVVDPITGVDDVLLSGSLLTDVRLEVRDRLWVAPAGPRLSDAEHITEGGSKRGWLLKNAIDQLPDDYDYVVIDCPPSAGLLGMNALFAADEVLIPVSGDYFGLHGLSRLMELFGHIESALGAELKKWVVVTRFQERRRLARDVREKLVSYFPGKVLNTSIRETVALAESPSFTQTIFEYKANGNGADDYRSLAEDIVLGRTIHG